MQFKHIVQSITFPGFFVQYPITVMEIQIFFINIKIQNIYTDSFVQLLEHHTFT